MARLETSAESPVPVRVVAIRIGEWIARLGEIWVDGQVAQLNRRPGVATQFLTLRDPNANVSMTVTCARDVLPESVGEGSRVVLRARPDFYLERGSLSLRATEIRPVGLGELLARLEELRRLLAAEGLLVADVAASTPTDAGRRIVPDLADERRGVVDLRTRARGCVRARLDREAELIGGLPGRLRR